jgi:translation elongation factor EF-1alpha
MGVRKIIVAINRMDDLKINYREDIFNKIRGIIEYML